MSVDKTKENIKARELDKRDRTELFDKFIKAGGKVIDERPKRKAIIIDKAKQREFLKKEAEAKKKRQEKWQKLTEDGDTYSSVSGKAKGKPSKGSLFTRLRINMKCWLLGVSPLSGYSVNIKFIEFLDSDISFALLSFHTLFFELFRVNPANGNRLFKALDARNPVYVEILERAAEIFDKHEFVKFSELLKKTRDSSVSLKGIENSIIKLFAKIWPFFRYMEIFHQAVDIGYRELSEIDHTNVSIYNRKRKQALGQIDLILTKLFPRLYWLFVKIKGIELPMAGQILGQELGVEPGDYLGQRKKDESLKGIEGHVEEDVKKKEKENEDENEETGEDIKEEPSKGQNKKEDENRLKIEELPKAVQIGLKLMRKFSWENMRKKFDEKNRFSIFNLKDKVFLVYLLFREFDNEFSFILTTNKITLKVDYGSGSKSDFNNILNDIFLLTDDIYEKFEQYVKISEETIQLKGFRPTQSGYIQHTKRVTDLENRQLVAARNFKSLVREMMERVAANMEILIRDAKGPRQIVTNSDERLSFDVNIEGKKKLNNQTIVNAFQYTYAYSLAFLFRLLDPKGDLHGPAIELDTDLFGKNLLSPADQAGDGEKSLTTAVSQENSKEGDSMDGELVLPQEDSLSDELNELDF